METTAITTTDQPQPAGPGGGQGRRRIEIKKIQDKNSLVVAFSKRRKGLFKKAGDFCNLYGAEVAIITFSPSGRPFSFGSPSAETVVERYLKKRKSKGSEIVEMEDERGGGEGFWWEERVDELDLEELKEYSKALDTLRSNLIMRIEDMQMRTTVARNYF